MPKKKWLCGCELCIAECCWELCGNCIVYVCRWGNGWGFEDIIIAAPVLAQSSIPLNQIIGIKLSKLDMSIESFQYTVREKLIARYNFIFVCALFTIFTFCCYAIPVIGIVSLHCVLVFILSGIVTVYTGPLVYAVNIVSLDKLLFKTLCVGILLNILFILAIYSLEK